MCFPIKVDVIIRHKSDEIVDVSEFSRFKYSSKSSINGPVIRSEMFINFLNNA